IRDDYVSLGVGVVYKRQLVGDNAGGHVAHFGGIMAGAVFGLLYNRGIDITRPVNNLTDRIVALFRSKGAPCHDRQRKTKFKFRPKKASRQQNSSTPSEADDRRNLDAILDKIKHSGYTALTADERRQLFDISRRVK
ncbi:MAG: hypothetical protein K2I25_01765, partial [Muribaculaceae bacterium]|nr:hypothetical protein [Muribaculaceae bacterium]